MFAVIWPFGTKCFEIDTMRNRYLCKIAGDIDVVTDIKSADNYYNLQIYMIKTLIIERGRSNTL